MKYLVLLISVLLLSGCISDNKNEFAQNNVRKNKLPIVIATDELYDRALHDERVRQYINPKKIIWISDNNGSEIIGVENLISTREEQVSLEKIPLCTMINNGEAPGILLDFGVELHGGIQIMIGRMDSKEAATFRVRFGESASEAMSDIGGAQNATNDHSVRDITLQAPWLGTIELGNTGFRFVRIDLLDKNRTVPIIGVRAIFLYRDLEYKGSFNSNDERLNRIWKTGAYTVHLNMQEYLWDGIKRDRLVWIGDMHPETMTILSVFGAHNIVPKSLDLVKEKTPLPNWMNGISSYSMWWLLIQYDWYLYTGNLEYLKKHKKYITALLSQLTNYIDENNSENLDGSRFLDWPTQANPAAVHAGLQAMLYKTMVVGGKLADLFNDPNVKQRTLEAAQRLKKNIPSPGNNKQAAALLALSGLKDANKMNRDVMAVGGSKGMSTFYGYYVLQARAMAGDYKGSLDVIREYWGAMLDLGATTFWEDFDLEWAKNSTRLDELPDKNKKDIHGDFGNYCYVGYRHSLCHGWASGPTAWLSEHILGIKPLEPGFKTVKIEPHLGDLEWVEGTFPTPYGPIEVKHEMKNGKVETTYNAPAEIKVILK